VKLRWVLVLAGALWLSTARPGSGAIWLIGATAVYGLAFTLARRVDRHPPLIVAAALDFAVIVALLVLYASPESPAPLLFVYLVVVLALAYGWPGVLLSLGAYVIGESALLLARAGATPDVAILVGRSGLLVFMAIVLGVLVARHDEIRARLARVMIHDRVTGLYNQTYFAQALEQIHKLATRGDWPYSVVVVQVDGLDRVSEVEGGASRDRLLRLLAVEAKGAIRSTDVVARTGPAEFAIALPETALPAAGEVARKVMHRMQDVEGRLELWAGAADVRPTRVDAFEDALHAAYAAASRAREGGDRLATLEVAEWRGEHL
jgi:diguanylate cyclase (GGDEF)-like protein